MKDRIETLAAQQDVSNNQFAMYAFTKEIGELDHVADRDVPDWDRPDITTGDIG